MKYQSWLLIVALAAVSIFTGCKTPTKVQNEYATYGFEITCLGLDADGTQMLRSWGTGTNKSKAIEQAKKNAVETVLFKGITGGTGDCNKRPLVNEVNARERYETYFSRFFADGGAYNKYVTLEEKRTSRIKSANSALEAWSVVVRVDRNALRERLVNDNLINK